MRVLVVTNMYPTDDRPAFGVFVHEQVASLRDKGLDVDVLFVNGKASTRNYVTGPRRVIQQIRKHRYDLVHAHYVFSGIMARAQRRAPLVVSFHGAGEMFGWVGWLCKALAPLTDAYTVTSEEHAAQLGRQDAHIIPCGINTGLFKPMSQQKARQQLGLSAEQQLVLFAADLRPEKRIDVAQEAIALLQAEGRDVRLVVATDRPHQEIPLYMNACDAIVLTSDTEGSPQVIKEAMACNTPIVSVKVGDVDQVIGDTEGCYLCERTPESVAQKLSLALDRGQRTQGRKAVAHLSLDRIADRVIALYKETLAKHGQDDVEKAT